MFVTNLPFVKKIRHPIWGLVWSKDKIEACHWLSSVQFSRSVVSDSLRPHESQHTRPPCPSPTPGSSLKLMSIESVKPSSHLIFCCPLLLLPPIPPSIRVFSNESTLHMRWPKYWSFSFSINSSNEHPGLISFRMDWLKTELNVVRKDLWNLYCKPVLTIQLLPDLGKVI